jgi:4,5-DOPA dioxygenase extradiol
MTERMPALFIGHGSPMNALVTNKWTEDWKTLGASLPRPRAIVAISAHWYTDGTGVTAVSTPRTIHDFGGFPRALFEVQYPAPGDPTLASDLTEILAPTPVVLDSYWGLDHGTWSVLVRMFPKADIPVVQLSIDGTAPPETHRALGERLASLRDKGVLLVGSGNVVHNLRAGFGEQAPEYDWAKRFDEKVRELAVSGDAEQLASYERLGPDAELCVPTPDHYYPLLYTVGARREGDEVTFPTEGLNGGVSMLAVKLG